MTYDEQSRYLRRKVVVMLSNKRTETVAFEDVKVSISGSKYIGIQQDNFTVKLNNIDYAYMADLLTKGYLNIAVVIREEGKHDTLAFRGEIRMVNVGKPSAIEREMEFVCLTRASDLLANMVVPLTMYSSFNGWTIKEALSNLQKSIELNYGETVNLVSKLDPEISKMRISEDYASRKSPVEIIEDLVSIANRNTSIDPKSANWFDFKIEDDQNGPGGLFSIFSDKNTPQVLHISPETGMLDAPSISDLEISFSHVYHPDLVPGRVVRLDNKWVSTMGASSAFVWAWDPEHLYLITEARYSFDTYPSKFTVSCKARSYTKYSRFTEVNKIYRGDN